MAKPDEGLLVALGACLANARDLLGSAMVVQAAGHHNIAYHLATLSLEEMGKRELYQIQEAAKSVGDPPAWQNKATQDHVKKLFWCFYSLGTVGDIIDQRQFFEKRDSASDIHANRLAGLYVDSTDGVLNIPSQAISPAQSTALIKLAESVVRYAETQKPRDEIPSEEADLQRWFLNATNDPELRKRLFSARSFEILRRENDVHQWSRLIRAELEAEDAALKELAERELQRLPTDLKDRTERWRIRIRLETQSNTVRPAFLKQWNQHSTWTKLVAVQGEHAKSQLIVEFTLGDDIPIALLWPFGLTLSLRFIIALNLATSGFWWWRLPPNQTKYYDSIDDLQKKGVKPELEPQGFRVFGTRAPMTEIHADTLVHCLVSLPDDPHDPTRSAAYTVYLGGLNFLALNSVAWRTEGIALGHFLQALKLMLVEATYILAGETAEAAIGRLLDEKYPDLDRDEHSKFVELARTIGGRQDVTVSIGDVYLMKLLCETIFRDAIVPMVARKRTIERGAPETDV